MKKILDNLLTILSLYVIISPESEVDNLKLSLNEVLEKFYAEFSGYESAELPWDDIEAFASKNGCEFCYGETRYCMFQKHWDEVLKIPRLDNCSCDYGKIELDNYNKACDLGIERIFLPCRQVCVLPNGCAIYAQTKFTKSHRDLDRKEQAKLDKVCYKVQREIFYKALNGMHDHYRIKENWFARAYQIYGKKFMRVLEAFTRENRIGDLHSSNLGWLGNQPVILDYAGFHG